MEKKNKIELTVQEWAENFSAPVIANILVLLRAEEKSMGPKCKNELVSTFLAGYVAATMYQSLTTTEGVKMTKEQRYSTTMTEFSQAKSRLAEAISMGFTMAMKNFSGKSIEYYCDIRPIPERTNVGLC